MAIIVPLEYEELSEASKAGYDAQMQAHGYVTNMKRTLLHAYPAFDALMQWYPLRDEAEKFIGPRGVVIFCHAISNQNDCLICSTYFRREFANLGVTPDNFQFSPKEELLESFGRRLADKNGVDEEFLLRLKNEFTDSQVVLLTAFGAMMVATNMINNTLKVELDDNLTDYLK